MRAWSPRIWWRNLSDVTLEVTAASSRCRRSKAMSPRLTSSTSEKATDEPGPSEPGSCEPGSCEPGPSKPGSSAARAVVPRASEIELGGSLEQARSDQPPDTPVSSGAGPVVDVEVQPEHRRGRQPELCTVRQPRRGCRPGWFVTDDHEQLGIVPVAVDGIGHVVDRAVELFTDRNVAVPTSGTDRELDGLLRAHGGGDEGALGNLPSVDEEPADASGCPPATARQRTTTILPAVVDMPVGLGVPEHQERSHGTDDGAMAQRPSRLPQPPRSRHAGTGCPVPRSAEPGPRNRSRSRDSARVRRELVCRRCVIGRIEGERRWSSLHRPRADGSY